jgi:hypothetical protein
MGSRMSEVINVKELSLSDINEMLELLKTEKINREDEEKNEAIQNFYNAWLKLRELGITPHYFLDGDDEDCYQIVFDDFNNFMF